MLNQCRSFDFITVKKLLVMGILATTSGMAHSVMALSTTEPPADEKLKPPVVGGGDVVLQGGEVLLIKDVNPWGTTANEDILSGIPISYDKIGSGAIPTTDFAPYKMIIIASDQPQSFYNIYDANFTKFSDYVSGGGVLQFNGGDEGWQGGFWGQLPGGVTHERDYDGTNWVVSEDHPIVAGVPSPFHGSSASHDHFLNFQGLEELEVITQDQASLPTTIEYCFEGGRVIASGVTLEAGHDWGWDYAQLLPNIINYAYDAGGCRGTCLGLLCTLEGTDSDDFLIGTNNDDVICGGEGNDTILGAKGDDVICGGPGDDFLVGNEGYDLIEGEEGDDFLEGDKHVDVLQGGKGNDTLLGDQHNDFLFGAAGQDYLDGGKGSDLLNGGTDIDTCDSGRILIGCE